MEAMKTEEVTEEKKKRRIDDFLARTKGSDSIVLVASRKVDLSGMVESEMIRSETITFIYPNHITAQINMLRQLADKLERVLNDSRVDEIPRVNLDEPKG